MRTTQVYRIHSRISHIQLSSDSALNTCCSSNVTHVHQGFQGPEAVLAFHKCPVVSQYHIPTNSPQEGTVVSNPNTKVLIGFFCIHPIFQDTRRSVLSNMGSMRNIIVEDQPSNHIILSRVSSFCPNLINWNMHVHLIPSISVLNVTQFDTSQDVWNTG